MGSTSENRPFPASCALKKLAYEEHLSRNITTHRLRLGLVLRTEMGHFPYALERPVLTGGFEESLIAVSKELDGQAKFGCVARAS